MVRMLYGANPCDGVPIGVVVKTLEMAEYGTRYEGLSLAQFPGSIDL